MIRLNDILDEAGASGSLSESDVGLIKKAYVYSAKVHAGQKRVSGEPYLSHPLEVSLILAKLGLDTHTIATGLLHDTVEDTLATSKDINRMFGDKISGLVDGATKVSKLSYSSDQERQAENFRKLILATAKDVRVVLIKLADRLHNMRTLEFLPTERRRKIAKETLEIYAPLARRFGIGWLASEIEDLSFRFLNPREYAKIEEKLKKGGKRRARKIKETTAKLEKRLHEEGVKCEVSGRVKNFYSIYSKMKWQNMEFNELYDIIAFRVVTESKSDCYAVLGEVHSLWNPVPGRIKDYIALPKSNGYQSIHTTVISSDGDKMEIQIRTQLMHEFAEKGIAAHWIYKENEAAGEATEIRRQFSRIGDLAEDDNDARPVEFMNSLKAELESSVIYVYTPKAELIELPVGSTPIDFAYRIHTNIGDRCDKAVVNRKSVPLDTRLKTGDVVEIKVSAKASPSEKWLSIVFTPQAKNRIRKHLSAVRRDKSLDIGRAICERRLAAAGKNLNSMIKLGEILKPLEKLGFSNPDDFFRMVGFGHVSASDLQKLIDPGSEITPKKMGRIERILDKVADPESRKMILVGKEKVMTRFSTCCLPVPGEPIVGHVTRGSGVVVHSAVCGMCNGTGETDMEVEWRKDFRGKATTGIFLTCQDNNEVLSSVDKTIDDLGVKTVVKQTGRFKEGIKYSFLFKVKNIKHLEEIVDSLSMLEGVVSVERCGRAFE
ncbi:MAG: RelA/SpoT family protein [Candidatus Mycalebacterium zealandia]|nr:MAG: RelA/SpoT family protein [Candidatus Mycalebacterium zealandia]